MCQMFCGEKPAMPGNSRCRSAARLDHGLAPAFPLLPLDDLPADVPVEADQLPAGADGRPDLGVADAVLDVFQEFGVARRKNGCRLPGDFCRRLRQGLALRLGHGRWPNCPAGLGRRLLGLLCRLPLRPLGLLLSRHSPAPSGSCGWPSPAGPTRRTARRAWSSAAASSPRRARRRPRSPRRRRSGRA